MFSSTVVIIQCCGVRAEDSSIKTTRLQRSVQGAGRNTHFWAVDVKFVLVLEGRAGLRRWCRPEEEERFFYSEVSLFMTQTQQQRHLVWTHAHSNKKNKKYIKKNPDSVCCQDPPRAVLGVLVLAEVFSIRYCVTDITADADTWTLAKHWVAIHYQCLIKISTLH